ncbi:MAG: hypothetical protein OER97_05115 [Gammaproteobacteria bacterium]|nr:hypothetical protein [Gammaproteobacteria bacterium]
MESATAFQYRAPWPAVSCFPGSHQGVQRGGGYEVYGTAPLYAGDPRRFDLRASLKDPFGQLLVRVYKQRSIVPVFVLADVSASMSFVGHARKFDMLIEFVESLAYSAQLVGDSFAFTACDTTVRDELSLPLTRARGAGIELGERLRRYAPKGADASGLLAGAERIPGSRALVFLISDYFLPLQLLRNILNILCVHAVIPVILVDSADSRVPGTGITHLYDPETQARRTILLRRSWATRFEQRLCEHREQIRRCLADYDLRPLDVIDRFEAEAVSRYFNE